MSAQKPSFEEQIADIIVETVKQATAPLHKRLAALEARPELKYGGVYAPNVTYNAGTLVTRSGGLWYCQFETRSAPGNDGSAWKLIVKSGGA